MPERENSAGNYRFGFNSQEKVDEITGKGNHNTALYWEYDMRLGRRWNLDPKTNSSISSYVVLANNSIFNRDLYGDVVKGATEVEDKLYADYKETVNKKIEDIQASINSATRNNQKEKLESELIKYQNIKAELTELENSNVMYRVRTGKNISSTSGGGNTFYNSNTNEVDINLVHNGDFSMIQTTAHEFLHAYQYEKGNLDFDADQHGGVLYDLYDEVDAYDRQNLFANKFKTEQYIDNTYQFAYDNYKNNVHSTTSRLSLKNLKGDELWQYYIKNFAAGLYGHKPVLYYKGWEIDYKGGYDPTVK
jgi:hypothetical protein